MASGLCACLLVLIPLHIDKIMLLWKRSFKLYSCNSHGWRERRYPTLGYPHPLCVRCSCSVQCPLHVRGRHRGLNLEPLSKWWTHECFLYDLGSQHESWQKLVQLHSPFENLQYVGTATELSDLPISSDNNGILCFPAPSNTGLILVSWLPNIAQACKTPVKFPN